MVRVFLPDHILKTSALNHRVEHSLRPRNAPIGSPFRFSWAISDSRDRDEKVKKERPKGRIQDPGHTRVSLRPKHRRVDDIGQDGVEGRRKQSTS